MVFIPLFGFSIALFRFFSSPQIVRILLTRFLRDGLVFSRPSPPPPFWGALFLYGDKAVSLHFLATASHSSEENVPPFFFPFQLLPSLELFFLLFNPSPTFCWYSYIFGPPVTSPPQWRSSFFCPLSFEPHAFFLLSPAISVRRLGRSPFFTGLHHDLFRTRLV